MTEAKAKVMRFTEASEALRLAIDKEKKLLAIAENIQKMNEEKGIEGDDEDDEEEDEDVKEAKAEAKESQRLARIEQIKVIEEKKLKLNAMTIEMNTIKENQLLIEEEVQKLKKKKIENVVKLCHYNRIVIIVIVIFMT